MTKLVAFVRLGRPLFLGGGFLLFALGAAIASATGHAIDARRYALGQGAVTALQWMTHYANEYFDVDADRANATPTRFSGGSRVLVDGALAPGVALAAARVLAAIAAALAIVLVASTDRVVAASLAATAALAWCYSAPPLRLCARGLGELATTLVVTVLVPWLGYYVQAPDLRGARLLALSLGAPALLQLAMMLAIELPDLDGDARANKRTLVVRIGAARAARLHAIVVAAAYAWLAAAWLAGLPARIALAAAASAPLAAWQLARMRGNDDRLTTLAVALLVVTSAGELVAWVLSS